MENLNIVFFFFLIVNVLICFFCRRFTRLVVKVDGDAKDNIETDLKERNVREISSGIIKQKEETEAFMNA